MFRFGTGYFHSQSGLFVAYSVRNLVILYLQHLYTGNFKPCGVLHQLLYASFDLPVPDGYRLITRR